MLPASLRLIDVSQTIFEKLHQLEPKIARLFPLGGVVGCGVGVGVAVGALVGVGVGVGVLAVVV